MENNHFKNCIISLTDHLLIPEVFYLVVNYIENVYGPSRIDPHTFIYIDNHHVQPVVLLQWVSNLC